MKNKINFVLLTILGSITLNQSHAQDGLLDLTFSTDGLLTTTFGGGQDQGNGTVIQSDGKILVAGYSYNGSNFDFALARYNSDGSLDLTFDTDGKVTTDFGTQSNEGRAIALQADGKILVAGNVYNGLNEDFAIARYNSDGSLDITFGIAGKVKTDVFGSTDFAYSIVVQSDQKILVGGTSYNGLTEDFVVIRYNINGTVDTGFSGDGIATTDFGSMDTGFSMDIQNDGKILLAGWTGDYPNADFAIARFDIDGVLDNTFDLDGMASFDLQSSYDQGQSVKVQSDGKIIMGGSSGLGPETQFSLVQINSDGSLDITFNTTGKLVVNAGPGNFDFGTSLALQSDDKIILAGYSYGGPSSDFAMIRVLNNGTIDNTFDTDGIINTDFANSEDVAYDVAVQNDNSIILVGVSNYQFSAARYLVNICNLSLGVSQVGFTLTSDEPLATYQWVDCDSNNLEIPGATNVSFTPIFDGNYAVVVSKNGCTDTSDCNSIFGLGVINKTASAMHVLYPNPASNVLYINFNKEMVNASIKIISINGQVMDFRENFNGTSLMFNFSDAVNSGIYFVEIIENDVTDRIKFLKN